MYIRALATFLIATNTVAFAIEKTEPSLFQAGIKAYEQSDYAAAKHKFIIALETNETAAARHNLGLTELQLKNPAEAIWQLERALLLDPSNQNYRKKLSLVREQLGLVASTRKWHQFFSQVVSFNVWMIIATISFWLLIVTLLLPCANGKSASGHMKKLRFFSSATLTLSLIAIWLTLDALKSGTVLSTKNVSLHTAPATAAPESGFARPGERARVLDRHNNFYQITTEGSATGWIAKDNFRLLVD